MPGTHNQALSVLVFSSLYIGKNTRSRHIFHSLEPPDWATAQNSGLEAAHRNVWEAPVLKDLAVEGKARLSLARTGSEVSSEMAGQGAAFRSKATAPPAAPDS